MTIAPNRLGRLRIANEPSNAFMTEITLGSFVDCQTTGDLVAEVITPRDMVEPGTLQQRGDAQELKVFLPKLGTKMKQKFNLCTADTRAGNGVAATRTWMTRIFEIMFGGPQYQGTGNVVSGGSSTVTTVDLDDASDFAVGGALGIVNSVGVMEMREIKSISGDTITLKLALSEAPSDTDVAYSCYSLGPDPLMRANTWLQAAAEGFGQEDKYLLRGGQMESLAITIDPGTICAGEIGWKFGTWDLADGVATTMDLTGAVLGLATYADINEVVAMESFLHVHPVGTTTLAGTQLQPSSIKWEFKLQWDDIRTVSLQTLSGFQRVVPQERAVLSGSFIIPLEDNTWFAYQEARTALAVSLQLAGSPTRGGLLFTAPTVQIDNVVKVPVNGIVGQEVFWTARLDTEADLTGLTAGTDPYERARQAARIHMF